MLLNSSLFIFKTFYQLFYELAKDCLLRQLMHSPAQFDRLGIVTDYGNPPLLEVIPFLYLAHQLSSFYILLLLEILLERPQICNGVPREQRPLKFVYSEMVFVYVFGKKLVVLDEI